jgi:hypothetical protein
MMCHELLLVTVLLAPGTDGLVQDITHQEPDFGNVAEPLHIIQKSGVIKLAGDVSVARIEIEHYREGKKLPNTVESVGVSPGAGGSDRDRIRFAVSFIDTDFLTLGDGKQGHCRVFVKLRAGSATSTTTDDVPKKQCDFSRMTSGGTFGPKASSQDRIPVFYMIDGRTASVVGGSTPEDVLKMNRKAIWRSCTFVFLMVRRSGQKRCQERVPGTLTLTEYVNASQSEAELAAIGRCVERGSPYGTNRGIIAPSIISV